MSKIATSLNIKEMYEKYPYPSSEIGDNLIFDLAAIMGMTLKESFLEDGKILDVGCGTGHRLVGLALSFPQLKFVGLDMTTKSIETASALAKYHGVENITFINDVIENYNSEHEFDIIISTGVLHHMENPCAGFSMIYKALKEDGLSLIWLYHTIGEFHRMMNRELVQLFAQASVAEKYYLNTSLLSKLNINLHKNQYGNSTTTHENDEIDQITIDVDAYLHPIVLTYSYNEIRKIALDAGFHGALCLGFNRKGDSKLIDSCNHAMEDMFLTFKSIYPDEDLNRIYESLDYNEQIRSLELAWKPTGITTAMFKSKNSLNKLASIFKGASLKSMKISLP